MSTMLDANRASYSKPNGSIRCGVKDALTPSVTVESRRFYTVEAAGKRFHCNTTSEVNAKLRLYPNAKVVQSERTTTIKTTHKRIR